MSQLVPITLKGDELNDRLGGGIPRNSLILIEAEDGLGKSVLAQRLLYGLIKEGNLTATILSTEMNTTGYIKQLDSFKYKIHKKLERNEVVIHSLFPTFGRVTFQKNLLKSVLESRHLFEKDLIVFDNLSNLLVSQDISDELLFDVIKFLKEISALNKIMIVTVNPKNLNEKFTDLLRSISDIYFRLEQKEQYGVIIRQMHVERFSGAGGEVSTPIPFKVLAGIGLALEISS